MFDSKLNTNLTATTINVSAANTNIQITSHIVRRAGYVVSGYVRFLTSDSIPVTTDIVKLDVTPSQVFCPIINIHTQGMGRCFLTLNGYIQNNITLEAEKTYIIFINYIMPT